MPWEYTSVECDLWLPVNVQGGWEAYAVTPPSPPTGDGDDPDQSSYEILLKRSDAAVPRSAMTSRTETKSTFRSRAVGAGRGGATLST